MHNLLIFQIFFFFLFFVVFIKFICIRQILSFKIRIKNVITILKICQMANASKIQMKGFYMPLDNLFIIQIFVTFITSVCLTSILKFQNSRQKCNNILENFSIGHDSFPLDS